MPHLALERVSTFLLVAAAAAALPAQSSKLTEKAKTAHFQIFYRPGSRAGAAVDRVAVLAERELTRICGQLGIKVGGAFELHLYDDLTELAELTGVKGSAGFSAGSASHVPFDNDQTRYHEMVHIVAFNLLPKVGEGKRNLFFAEGLANACLEFVHGVPVHAVAKYYKSQGVLPALKEMTGPVDFYAWLRARAGFNAYDVAGSYVRFLLDCFGPEKTTRYYTGVAAKAAFGVGEAELEKLWHKTLDEFVMRAELEKLLRERNKGPVAQMKARKRPAGLPPELIGKPGDWTSLAQAKLIHGDDATWRRSDRKIIGSSKAASWSVCELGTKTYQDCVVRVTIRTKSPVPIQVRLGDGNQGMLVNGTFLYRGDTPVASSQAAAMDGNRTKTDFVLVRRKGRIEIWIDGRQALTTSADESPAPVGLAFHGGSVVFEDVRVRELR